MVKNNKPFDQMIFSTSKISSIKRIRILFKGKEIFRNFHTTNSTFFNSTDDLGGCYAH